MIRTEINPAAREMAERLVALENEAPGVAEEDERPPVAPVTSYGVR